MKWYDWGSRQNQLITFGRAIQGVTPYKVMIEPDIRRCETGWCNYSKRAIAVNPNLFPSLSPADQYRITKAILVHEAGHRRFTTPSNLGPVTHGVFNVLEDERIERLMIDHFAGLGHLLVFLSGQMLKDLPAMNAKSDNPAEVLNFMLRLRWSERIGVEIAPTFSTSNAKKWSEVEPLVRRSWMAQRSSEVEETAKQVAAILNLREFPEWLRSLLAKLGELEGKRAKDDEVEEGRDSRENAEAESSRSESPANDEDFDGLPLLDEHPTGSGDQEVTPVPYLPLVAQVKPLVEELVAELSWKPKAIEVDPEPRGGRFNVRQWVRHPNTPFLVEEDTPRQLPKFDLRVLIDHSTSMNSLGRMSAARQGAMLLHLVCVHLGITHCITLTPNDLRIADLASGERGLALIAGLKGAMMWEGIDVTLQTHADELKQSIADVKLVLVIHDGYPDNPNQVKSLCQLLRGKMEVIGLGLGYNEKMAEALKDLFGSDRLILCGTAQELPKKLGQLLRAIYGR